MQHTVITLRNCAVSRHDSAYVPDLPGVPLAGNIKSASEMFPRMISSLPWGIFQKRSFEFE